MIENEYTGEEMNKPFKRKVAKLINSLPGLWYLLSLYKISRKGEYLWETGWLNSSRHFSSLDAQSIPIPWLTYAFLDFIEPRLSKDFKIFEYGGGNSTFWWAERVSTVHVVEHDKEWHGILKEKLPKNVDLSHVPLNKMHEYAKKPIETMEKYNLVIIDGRHRNLCARECVSALSGDGVIVWDNSDCKKYENGIFELVDRGYKKIEFFGLSPINSSKTATSVFYKEDNCLAI